MNSFPSHHHLLISLLIILTIFNLSKAQNTSTTNLINQIEGWKQEHQINLIKDHREAIVFLLIFIASLISSAGGVGGGPLFIPILNLVADLKLKTATTYSSFMVTGVMVANVLYYIFFNKLSSSGRPLINYEIAMLSEPTLLLGVSVGVVCNVMFPEWLITALFVGFLVLCTYKTCCSGVKCWRKESVVMREGEGLLLDNNNHQQKVGLVWKDLVILALVWICFCIVHLFKECVTPCSILYWLITFSQVPLAVCFTMYIVYGKRKPIPEDPEKENQDDDEMKESHLLTFPIAAVITGALSGLFGIGGGLLLNPLLLQMGVPPQTAAATSTFMLLFSSSMSMFQYILLGMKGIEQASIYGSLCFVASAIGLTIVQRMVRSSGRVSLIIFAVTIVMGISTVVITAGGIVEILKQYANGDYMGFKFPC